VPAVTTNFSRRATVALGRFGTVCTRDDAVIERIADSVGRTPAQVVLRWHIQRGDIVFPKSVSPDRMRANFELFDFELGGSDMDAISALDRGESARTGPKPDEFDYVAG
jgi:2,5-diketo-D-gluconate reductase A